MLKSYYVFNIHSSPRRVVGKPSRLNWSENARKRVKVSPVLQYLTVGALSAGRPPPSPVRTSCDLCSVKTTHLQTIRQFGVGAVWLVGRGCCDWRPLMERRRARPGRQPLSQREAQPAPAPAPARARARARARAQAQPCSLVLRAGPLLSLLPTDC